jgi:CPA2 family monovalent cation:H+ antiporter-2
MLTAFKKPLPDSRELVSKKVHYHERRKAHLTTILNYLVIVILLGALSTEFMTIWISVTATATIAASLLLIFRRRLEIYFRWFEKTFISGLSADIEKEKSSIVPHDHLLPWNGYLSAVDIEQESNLAGKTLIELGLREKFSITVMVVQRGKEHVVAPSSSFQIFPGDRILCFGSDDNMDTFKKTISIQKQSETTQTPELELANYALWAIEIAEHSQLLHKSIRESRIQERYKCMIVGLQRKGMRTQSPPASTIFEAGDQVWAVGATPQLQVLKSIGDGSIIDMIKN